MVRCYPGHEPLCLKLLRADGNCTDNKTAKVENAEEEEGLPAINEEIVESLTAQVCSVFRFQSVS